MVKGRFTKMAIRLKTDAVEWDRDVRSRDPKLRSLGRRSLSCADCLGLVTSGRGHLWTGSPVVSCFEVFRDLLLVVTNEIVLGTSCLGQVE